MKASMGVTVVFVLIVLVSTLGLWWGIGGHRRVGESEEGLPRWRWVGGVTLLLWMGLTGTIAYLGALRRFDLMPPPFGVLMIVSLALTSWAAFSSVGARLLARVPLFVLVLAQGMRIPIELVLHQLYVEGVLPVQMTYAGMNFDILSGVSGLLVGWLLWRGKLPDWGLLLWNITGLGLLVTIVTIALLSAPFPFRVFMDEPSNTIIAYMPFIWLPVILVQMALLGHLLVFRTLWRRRGGS